MKKQLINKIKLKIRNQCDRDFTRKIDISAPIDAMPMMNNRCQHNAVHAVKKGDAVAVVECLLISDTDVVAHYINLTSNGDYVDFTLGWSWAGGDYRFIRILNESEYGETNESLSALKEKISSGHIGRMAKILNIDKWDLC